MYFWERQKTVTALYDAIARPVCEQYGLTRMEYDILMFLHNHPQYSTAAEIVRVRRLTKSHVSSALKLLEEKGLVEKDGMEADKRRVRLRVASRAMDIVRRGEKAQADFGCRLLRGFTPEELEACRAMLDRMHDNASDALKEER